MGLLEQNFRSLKWKSIPSESVIASQLEKDIRKGKELFAVLSLE